MAMDGKVVAIVITYFPDANETVLNIKQYIDYIDKLIIWENTPTDVRSKYKISIPEYSDKILYMSTDKNEGIAYPLNRCVIWAVENEYDYILSMDQDSYWENFEVFLKCVSSFAGNQSTVDWVMTPNINQQYQKSQKFAERDSFITSGTLFPTSVILKTGYFNEALFLDGVDLDYSLRVLMNNVKIIVIPNAHLKQNYGYPIKLKYFKFSTSNYSAARTFNIVRNHILIYRKYCNYLLPFQKGMIFKGYILSRLVKVIVLEKSKFAKISAILRGTFAGIVDPLTKFFN